MQKTWMSIGLFLLEMVILSITSNCPMNCKCMYNDKEAKCKSGSIFPNGFNFNLRVLTIWNIRTYTLQEKTFDKRGLSTLEELHIRSCQIQNIHESAFRELRDLQYLDLSNNRIKYLDTNVFKTNTKLTVLILNSNQLEKGEVFPVVQSLKQLSLVNCHINEIQPTFFKGLPNLEHLNLSDNYLEYLSADIFEHLPNLVYLDLKRNKWICDCKLEPFVLWYLSTFSVASTEVQCGRPAGKLWTTDSSCFPNINKKIISSNTRNSTNTRNIATSTIETLSHNAFTSINNIGTEGKLLTVQEHLPEPATPATDTHEPASNITSASSTISLYETNIPTKLPENMDIFANYHISLTSGIFLVSFTLISIVVASVLATLVVIMCRDRRSKKIVEQIPLNNISQRNVEPVISSLHLPSQMTNRNEGLHKETYNESASSCQGYLVPRRHSDYHVYEEIE